MTIFKNSLTQTTEKTISHLYSPLAEFFNCICISCLEQQNAFLIGVKKESIEEQRG